MSKKNLRTDKYEIPPKCELRFEISTHSYQIYLTLIEGNAEIYGSPLELHHKYNFGLESRICLYSDEGCKVLVVGYADEFCISEKTAMIHFLKSHEELELLRHKAQRENKTGPMVIIMGESGKGYFGKVLVNHAFRNGWTPIFADLTPGALKHRAGTLGYVVVNDIQDFNDTFDSQSLLKLFHYGYKSLSESTKLYMECIRQMAQDIHEALNENDHVKHSGLVLLTCGFIKNFGFHVLLESIKLFDINVLYVMNNASLMEGIKEKLPHLPETLELFPDCNFSVNKLVQNARLKRDLRCKRMFFSDDRNVYPKIVDIDQMKIYFPQVNRWNKVTFADRKPDMNIKNFILSITKTTLIKDSKLKVLGHIYITMVDEKDGKVHGISTISPLPEDAVFLLTNIFHDENVLKKL